jgi:hypothetical protein
MRSMWRRLTKHIPPLAIGVIAGLMVGGGAFAVAATTGNHGGPKPRFHDSSECKLVDVSTLPGNWTHGDYVSAVEKKDPSKVQEAAHSRCGKPTHAGTKDKNKTKGKEGKEQDAKERSEETSNPAPRSPKPTPGRPKPSSTPSPTGSASPVVPLPTAS